jgi:hypothetical protein
MLEHKKSCCGRCKPKEEKLSLADRAVTALVFLLYGALFLIVALS